MRKFAPYIALIALALSSFVGADFPTWWP